MEFQIKEVLVDVVGNLTSVAAEQVPRIVTALVVVIVGAILAKLVEKILSASLRRLHFDALLERLGVKRALERLGLRQSPSRAISRLIYLLLVILFVQAATVAVGLDTIADAIGAFFTYLPNVVSAAVVALLGSIIAQFAGDTVSQAAQESGVDFAPGLGRMVAAVIMFVVALMAINQLKIDTAIIHTVVTVVLSAMALMMALSFGLGSRHITRSIVAGYYVRKLVEVGKPIQVAGESGVLRAVTPTSVLVEGEDGTTVSISNSKVFDEVVKQG